MFGKKKKSKNLDSEKQNEELEHNEASESQQEKQTQKNIDDSILGVDKLEKTEIVSEKSKEKKEQLNYLKNKISKILRSSNIEIVDENENDEFEGDSSNLSKNEKQQQDYDALKAIFGKDEKSKKKELTLTIDDFDYSYVGKYVEDYDLMHLKSIKKVRIQHKIPKFVKGIIIGVVAVAVISLSTFLAVTLTKEKPVTISSVSLTVSSQEYFVNDNFQYSGIYFNVTYSDGTTKKIALSQSNYVSIIGPGGIVDEDNEITFSSSGELTITFSYGGFSNSIDITVNDKYVNGLSAIYSSGLFSMSGSDYINEKLLNLILNYSNTDSEYIDIYDADYAGNVHIYIGGISSESECVFVEGSGYKLPDGSVGTNQYSKIYITYYSSVMSKTFTLEISYQEGVSFVSKVE